MARKPLPSVAPAEHNAADPSRRGRRRFLLGALAPVAMVLSGCVILKSVTPSQLEVIGKVQLTTVLCATDKDSNNAGYSPADATCQGNTTAQKGNSGQDSANNSNVQLMVAYRVPNATTPPSSFTSTNTSNPPTTPCGSGVTFNQSTSYENALEAGSSSGADQKWAGYISTAQNFTTAGCQYVPISPQFALVQGFGVAPFVGPFTYRTVAGYRTYDNGVSGSESTRTVTCGSSPFTLYNDGADGGDAGTEGDQQGICVDHPYGGASAISTNDSQATRDLGVLPTANASVNAGQTAQVDFSLWYRGAALPSGQFNITANTTIPGATATPSPTTLVPAADSDNSVNVSVPVPPGTTPGTYNVFVIATLSTDPTQTRGGLVPATIAVGENFNFNPAPTLPGLGTITLNGQAQTKTAQMNNFGVIDSPGSSDAGWNVTVAGDGSGANSAVFKQYCPNGGGCGADPQGYVSGGFTLPANSMTLNSTGAGWSGGTGSTPTFSCGGGSCAIDSATPTKIASAANGGGTGLWTTSSFSASSVSLATASTLRALPASEQYKVNVVWTLNSGP